MTLSNSESVIFICEKGRQLPYEASPLRGLFSFYIFSSNLTGAPPRKQQAAKRQKKADSKMQ